MKNKFFTCSAPTAVGRNLRNVPNSIILIALTLILGIVSLCSNDTYATESTLSLTIDNSTVSMSMSPTNVNGTFNKSSSSTVSASTNNATGYTLSIAAPSSSGADYDKLINGSDNNAKLTSISEATTEETFKGLDNTSYNGKWGYLPSKYHSQDNTEFLPAPTTNGDILDQTSAANTTPNNYSLAIGARVDSSVKTGSYTNVFLVTAVANPIPYTITYVDNVVGDMPVDIDATSVSTNVPISSNVPTRNGYAFLGWCDIAPVASGGVDTCSGTVYNPNGGGTDMDITISQTGGSNNFTLYAMWSKNVRTSINDLVYMQDFASLTSAELARVKSSMTTNASYQLTDSRDGKKYWITKLQTASSNPRSIDGYQIWMTQNLDLDLSTSVTLSSENTDLRVCGSGIYSSGYAFTSGNCYWTPDVSTVMDVSATSAQYYIPQSYNPGDVYYYQNQSASNICTATNTCLHWHAGNYYNWSAVVASNDSSSQTAKYSHASNSICPAGWQVPTGLTSDDGYTDFNYLLVQQGIITNYVGSAARATWGTNGLDNIQISPIFFIRAGYFEGSGLNSGRGDLWSSSVYSERASFGLFFGGNYMLPADSAIRSNGKPVRCLVRE